MKYYLISFFASLAFVSVSFCPKTVFFVALTENAMDSSAFDFWIGTWEAKWGDISKPEIGRSIVTHVMKDKVIHENFEILTGAEKGFKGGSYSVLEKSTGKWKQTWVDSENSYLDFEGYEQNGTKCFERKFTNNLGKTVKQRMKFYDIKSDSFTWDWESSTDDGEWQLRWRIFYRRTNFVDKMGKL